MKFVKEHNVKILLFRPSTGSRLELEVWEYLRPFNEWTYEMIDDLVKEYQESFPDWEFDCLLE